jgi:hypothetical protein
VAFLVCFVMFASWRLTGHRRPVTAATPLRHVS